MRSSRSSLSASALVAMAGLAMAASAHSPAAELTFSRSMLDKQAWTGRKYGKKSTGSHKQNARKQGK